MTLEDWSQLTTRSVFDYSIHTVARAWSPQEDRLMGYVVFSAGSVPYAVFAFRTIGGVADFISRGMLRASEVKGTVYSDEEWARVV